MRKISKTVLAALLVLCIASLTACIVFDPTPSFPTAAPTEVSAEAPTAAPTEAPTAAPTEAPTAAPTAAPTETPDPTEAPAPVITWAPLGDTPYSQRLTEALSKAEMTPFEDCGEKVMALAPDDPGPYYWYDPLFGPTRFSVFDNKIYISDGGNAPSGFDPFTVFVFDMNDGSASRILLNANKPYGYMSMVVSDGIVYSSSSAEDLTSRDEAHFDEGLSSDGTDGSSGTFMTAWDENISIFNQGEFSILDTESYTWSEFSRIEAAINAPLPGSDLVGIFPDGTLCFYAEGSAGGHITAYVIHTDREQNMIAWTELPYDVLELEPTGYSAEVIAAQDGYVYAMACFENEVAVWKIDLH